MEEEEEEEEVQEMDEKAEGQEGRWRMVVEEEEAEGEEGRRRMLKKRMLLIYAEQLDLNIAPSHLGFSLLLNRIPFCETFTCVCVEFLFRRF